MSRWSKLSIRSVIVSLGTLSILIAAALAGFGLLALEEQLSARQKIVTLDRALRNHNAADAFMDNVRDDVLRAVVSSLGANKESVDAIRAELLHHIDMISTGVEDNRGLALTPALKGQYEKIGSLMLGFIEAGRGAVELALADPVAGRANYERFRGSFSELEETMDSVRDVLQAEVKQVRDQATATATRSEVLIWVPSCLGILLLAFITAVAVKVGQRITSDLAVSREESHRLSLHDTLTNLPNRTFLAQRLEEDLDLVRRDRDSLAVMCLDLDRFKQVNDTLGHHTGDVLLRAVADRVRACLSEGDTIARLGGDEFAIVKYPASDTDQVHALAARIIHVLSQPYDLDGNHVVIGTSIGIALAPGDSLVAGELLKMADMALYRAKAEGRGIFRMFEPEMDRTLQARRLLELDLRKGLQAEEFEVHYQPLIDTASNAITCFEALVRWRHPQKGLVPPSEFIPLAEETGIIDRLGAWVLEKACADAVHWPEHVRVAVNVSAKQFKSSGLFMVVVEALATTGLDPGRLELEITETALLADVDATLAVLKEIRALGVRIAMDDFGTGYSSLGYLRSFPFDKIKIDRCFVRDIETSADCKAIVRAVTGLGNNLGIATTAEGVETIEQLDKLRAEGCDEVQGYLFSRPVPAAQANVLVHEHRPSRFVNHPDPEVIAA